MKILVACDSFKDALSAEEVCRAIAAGIGDANPALEVERCPLADGGEGTYEVLAHALQLQENYGRGKN